MLGFISLCPSKWNKFTGGQLKIKFLFVQLFLKIDGIFQCEAHGPIHMEALDGTINLHLEEKNARIALRRKRKCWGEL